MDLIPSFETERLILRAPLLSDADAYERNFNDERVISNLSRRVPWPYPRGGAREYLTQIVFPNQGKNRWMWGLFLKSHPNGLVDGLVDGLIDPLIDECIDECIGECIGAIELWRPGTPENRGFWLAPSHWGIGLMSEALTPITDYAFRQLGFDRLIFANARGNLRSRRIKEKSGAKLIGIQPGKYVNPEFTEQEVWELTREVWLHPRETPHTEDEEVYLCEVQQDIHEKRKPERLDSD